MAYFNNKKILSVVKTEFIPAVYQAKTITPTNQQRVITADYGYAALSSVTLDGILVDPHQSYTSSTDSTTAYQKSVPAGALKYATLDKLGGMSYKCNNLFDKDSYTYSNKYYNSVGSLVSATDNSMHNEAIEVLPNTQYTFSVNTAQAFLGVTFFNDNTFISKTQVVNTTSITFTTPNDCNKVYFNTNYNTQAISANYLSTIEPMLNTGSTALPYQPYFTDIRDSAVTSVVSKDSSNTQVDVVAIPNSITALEGYGWGINSSVYNYIDFENKKFIQKVGRVDLGSLNWSFNVDQPNCFRATLNDIKLGDGLKPNCLTEKYTADTQPNTRVNDLSISIFNNTQIVFIHDNSFNENVAQFKTAMSGVYLYYELATPVETDISEYIDDNFIEVEGNGSLTFTNTYEQDVPSEVTYLVEV